MPELRAGLIGLGMMGRNHLRVLHQLAGVRVVGVADPVGDGQRLPDGVTLTSSAEELVGLGLDICVVAAPTADHEPLGLLLADAGVHTLIEKPLAEDVAGAGRLTTAFEQAGLVGAVGHIERFNPALQSLRARLQRGELGDIYQLATRRVGPFPGRIRDVGVVKDLATHDVDLTAWVAGSDYASLAARVAHKSGREHEDLVAATGVLRDGTITNHLVNWLSPMKERLTVVTGERGTFVADTLSADLTFYANGEVATEWEAISRFRGVSEGDMVRFAIPKPEPLVVEHESFRDAVLGKDAEIVTMRQGMAAVEVATAMLRSAATGETIRLGDG
jgi:UDP-N-acetylglucosamine 3-dehydrogenase